MRKMPGGPKVILVLVVPYLLINCFKDSVLGVFQKNIWRNIHLFKQSLKQSIEQSTEQSMKQSIEQSIEVQSIKQSIKQ